MAVDMTFNVGTMTAVQPFRREILGFAPGSLLISVEGQDVRFWYGGGSPTTATGHKLVVGAFSRFVKTAEIEALKIISTAGTAIVSATVGGS
jgi:hypothetical protein